MIQRSDSDPSRPHPASDVRRTKRERRRGRLAGKQRARRLLMEGLETRQLLAGDVTVPIPDINVPTFDVPRNIGTVASFTYNESENTQQLGFNDFFSNAELVPLGTGPGQQDTVDIQGSLPVVSSSGFLRTDVDTFAVDLRAGDILDVSATGAAGSFSVLYENGGLWFGASQNVGGLIEYAPGSPLMTAGNAVGAQVVPEDGRYFITLAPGSSLGSYTTGLRVYRPAVESLPVGTQQVIYIDYDGATYPASIFGNGNFIPGFINVPSLEDTLPELGVQSDDGETLERLERGITAEVERMFQYVADNGNNGDFDANGTPGQYGVTILNSRDHADPGANPLVTRVIVGGTAADTGIPTLGLSSTLDVGNFKMDDLTFVILDSENTLDLLDGENYAPTASIIDAMIDYLALTVAHEAGHTFGLLHTVRANTTVSIIDGQIDVGQDIGIGPDDIYGTTDDVDVNFIDDRFQDLLVGRQRITDGLANLLVTGTQGGNVTGSVFRDANRNGLRGGEDGLEGIRVFADANGNGILDPTEAQTVTDVNGNFALFAGPGSYDIRLVVPAGFTATTATSRAATVAIGESVSGVNFGLVADSTGPTGRVFSDDNGNGQFDAGESFIEGVYIYADLDGDDRPDLGEPGDHSDAFGRYSIQFPAAGTYTIRSVPAAGLDLTVPSDNEYEVVFDGVATNGDNFDFGFQQSLDFSDAPASYGVASHAIVDGLTLGAQIDRDFGALSSDNADGDDLDGIDDEDGVVLAGPLSPGRSGSITVSANNTTGGTGFLHAWVDLNQDGTFSGSEKLISGLAFGTGTQTIDFDIPATATLGETIARFRYSNDAVLGPTGSSASGEVEDYQFTLVDTSSSVVNDSFNVPRNSEAFPLDVLANDFESAGNLLTITNVNTSAVEGQVVIAGDGRSIFYSPPDNFVGTEVFSYVARDQFGNEGSASVTVTVEFNSQNPIAIDDTFDIPQNSSNRPLNVLENDLASIAGGLTITSVTPGSAGGTVVVVSGGQSLRYTPQPGFAGTEEFVYSIQDPAGNVDSATVTVNSLPGARNDDIVDFIFSATDTVNNMPITDIQVGDRFNLTVSVDDLRDLTFDPEGVASAFLDVLYTDELVSIVPGDGIRYGEFFAGPDSFSAGSIDRPGLIDEVGAVQEDVSDLQSHDGPAVLFTVTVQAVAPGVAVFRGNPADDVVSETVVIGSDEALTPGEQRLGSVSIAISPAGQPFPSAIDDAFLASRNAQGDPIVARDSAGNQILPNGGPYQFDVLDNDLFGATGTIQEFSIEVAPGNGVATINNNGTLDLTDDFVQFTPNIDATGNDSLVYSFVSGDGVRSTATVNFTVGTVADADLLVAMDLQFVDTAGNSISTADVGDIVGVRIDLDDVRAFQADQAGVFAGFLDLLYDAAQLTPVTEAGAVPGADLGLGFAVEFGEDMQAGAADGSIARPGIIDEFGTNDESGDPAPGSTGDPRELATIYFRAVGTGTAIVSGSPADSFPFHDTLLFQRDTPVPTDNILYGQTQTLTIGSGEGESARQNSTQPTDVNNDGFVTSIDALLIINELNRSGNSASGESAPLASGYYTDVNGDNKITALDALNVINYLNRMGRSSSASAEGEAAPLASTAPATRDSNDNDAVFAELGDADKVVGQASRQDDLVAPPLASSTTETSDDEDDDVLGLLANDLVG